MTIATKGWSKRIGTNIGPDSDYDHPISPDLFKNSGGLATMVDTPGYVSDYGNNEEALKVDLAGYPIDLPVGKSAVGRLHTINALSDGSLFPSTTWHLLYDGEGHVQVLLQNADASPAYLDSTTSGDTFDWDPAVHVSRYAIVSQNEANRVRNLRLVNSAYLASYLAQPFRDGYYTKFQSFGRMRAMDPQYTNFNRFGGDFTNDCSLIIKHPVAEPNPHRRWYAPGDVNTEVRPVKGQLVIGQTSGAQGYLRGWDNFTTIYEFMPMNCVLVPVGSTRFVGGEEIRTDGSLGGPVACALIGDVPALNSGYDNEASMPVMYVDHSLVQTNRNRGFGFARDWIKWGNQHGTDLHVCIPHLASDEWVAGFRDWIMPQLTAGQNLYIEYSNEVWNLLFGQAQHAQQSGVEDGLSGSDDYRKGAHWYAKRATEIFAIMRTGLSDPTRVKRILAWQNAGSSVGTEMLDSLVAGGVAAYTLCDEANTAFYFQADYTGAASNADCKTACLAAIAATAADAAAWKAICIARSIAYGFYEGGPHDTNYSALQDALILAFHSSAEMGDCITQLMTEIVSAMVNTSNSTAAFCYYSDLGRWMTRGDTFGGNASYWPSQIEVEGSAGEKLQALLDQIAADVPPVHTSVSITAHTAGTQTLGWTLGAAGQRTRIYKSLSGTAGTFSLYALTAANATSQVVSSLTAGTPYYYQVRSDTATGVSDPVSVNGTTDSSSPPGVPSIIVAAVAPSGGNTPIQITVTPGTGAVTTNLEKSLDNFATAATELSANVSGVYTDTTAAGNTVAYYRSHSINPDGTSAYCTIGSALAYPKKPTLAMSQLTATSNRGVCTAGAGGAASFKLRRSADGAGSYSQVQAGAGPNLDDTTAVEGVPVDYEARSVNASGDSESSTKQDVTTLPATITGLVAVPLPGKVGVSWVNPSTHSSITGIYIADTVSGPWTFFDYFPPDVLSLEYISPTDLPDEKFFSAINETIDGTLSARSNVDSAAPLPHEGGSGDDPEERFMFVSQEHFPRMFAASVRTGKFKSHAGAELLRVGTVVAFDTSTTPGMWVPWTEGGSNGGNIPRAIVMPDPIQLKTGNEVLGDIMVVGVIHVDDLIDHANQSSSQALRDALVGSSDILRKNKIIIRGLPGVR